ncbi:HEXXH motif-containing putative peptide modification protein [Dactylosporangium sp. NPDC049140]|uniref:aKG-HExxH-type peptide beta-hydroxylase n=1 Tax=Dactylosporangium sp. NPDC049140 TaxID=3155647 RepID=UPI0033C48B45
MNAVRALVIGPEDLDELATGRGGDGVLDTLRAGQITKHVLLVGEVAHAARARAPEAARVLAAADARDPAATRAVLGHPQVGAWAIHCLTGAATPADLDHLHGVAAAAAAAAGLDATWPARVPAGRLAIPTLGTARVPGQDTVTITVEASRPAIAGGPGWLPLRRLEAGPLRLYLDDLDPYRGVYDLPVTGRLDDAEAARWQADTAAAGALLAAHHPWHLRSMSRCLTSVVPLAATGRSATSRDAFGAAALARPPDPRHLAAGLVHEQQHGKLNALLLFHDMLRPDAPTGRYYAPWRTDPRPPGALLHGCYAHLAIADFWRTEHTRTADDTAAFEFTRWRVAVSETLATLDASEALGPAGQRLVDGMRARLDAWRADEVPPGPRRRALATLAAHRAEYAAA